MKKLILKMSVSIDGFVAGPKGEADWIFKSSGKDVAEWDIPILWKASHHLMGSRTYQDMAAWWPTSKGDYAAPMNEIPKVVFSRRGLRAPSKKLTTASLKSSQAANRKEQGAKPSAQVISSWVHPTVCTGKLSVEIKRLKQGSGKVLVAHGGASFARSLIETGLIDQYMLLVHPVILGRGMAIFSGLRRPIDLQLVDSVSFKAGAVMNIYRPAHRQRPK